MADKKKIFVLFIIIIAAAIGLQKLAEYLVINELTPIGAIVGPFQFADWLLKQNNPWVICVAVLGYVVIQNRKKK
jgi:hypothetical protein